MAKVRIQKMNSARESGAKEQGFRRDLMREQLAYRAARLMAEDGITDHSHAKRKAARQLGANDTHHLPSNEEIDSALQSIRVIFQSDRHPEILRQLREEALKMMMIFREFNPLLTGSVLSGTAGEQSDINLMIFIDDEKSVLLFLLKHNIAFEGGEWKSIINGREETVPSYTLNSDTGIQTHLVILPEKARFSGNRKTGMYADINALQAMLEE